MKFKRFLLSDVATCRLQNGNRFQWKIGLVHLLIVGWSLLFQLPISLKTIWRISPIVIKVSISVRPTSPLVEIVVFLYSLCLKINIIWKRDDDIRPYYQRSTRYSKTCRALRLDVSYPQLIQNDRLERCHQSTKIDESGIRPTRRYGLPSDSHCGKQPILQRSSREGPPRETVFRSIRTLTALL